MLLVIDSGNTRTKWALVDSHGVMPAPTACLNTDLSTCELPQAAKQASKVLVAHVADAAVAQQITQLLAPLNVHFISAKSQACGLINQYAQAEKLGADRWAALIAAWQLNKQATLVVNAGTAITIDCLVEDSNGNGLFLGGTIMPGLRLMQAALRQNTAQLKVGEGLYTDFANNTQDAIQTGCLNAAVGAVSIMLHRLQQRSGLHPKLLISGGDAATLAEALNVHLKQDEKQVMIIDNLVLQGLVLLQKEYL